MIQSHEPELVHSLVTAAVTHGDALAIRKRALSWLLNLTRQSHSVRSQIVSQDKVEDLVALATPNKSEKNEWFIAANVLSMLIHDSAVAAKLSARDKEYVISHIFVSDVL